MAEGPKTNMPARRRARKRALDVLYEADLRDLPVPQVLAAYVERLELPKPEHMPYAITLVEGVNQHLRRIDETISTYAEGWTIDRMPVVDRNLARIAIYELFYLDGRRPCRHHGSRRARQRTLHRRLPPLPQRPPRPHRRLRPPRLTFVSAEGASSYPHAPQLDPWTSRRFCWIARSGASMINSSTVDHGRRLRPTTVQQKRRNSAREERSRSATKT